MAERHRLKESERSETVSATQYQAAALQHKAFWVMPDTLKRTEGWWDKTVTEGKQRGPQGTDRGIERGQMTREGQQTVNQEARRSNTGLVWRQRHNVCHWKKKKTCLYYCLWAACYNVTGQHFLPTLGQVSPLFSFALFLAFNCHKNVNLLHHVKGNNCPMPIPTEHPQLCETP